MKKRLASLLLAVLMTVTALAIPAGASTIEGFSDVTDQRVALAAESLRIMGVLDGYGDGTFHPNANLTRGQFCKMAVYAIGAENTLGLYNTTTVFPDVKPSYWAAGYINLAAKGRKIIAGYPDGKFHPNDLVTAGQAVTILLRLLGCKDETIGGVWPDSYMATASLIGLTENLNLNPRSPLTRGQAAQLFANLLRTESQGEGGVSYTLSEETELLSVDGSTGEMRTTGKTYPMAHPVSSTGLIGARGHVVELDGKAMTFLALTGGNAGTASSAIVLYADKSADGFGDLAGNNNYTIYKNGSPATINDLRKNDVASYNPATNSIRVCDTRVTVYYESCDPSPSEPKNITVLGGTRFSVLPSAVDTLSAFKPGDQITLLLTADGQVAGAVKAGGSAETRGNALGVVSESGEIQMLCAGSVIPLEAAAGEQYREQVVRIAASEMNKLSLSVATGGQSGDLNVSARKLGSRDLAENVMIYQEGALTSLNSLTNGVVRSGQIAYARANWAGEIDLVVLKSSISSTVVYGRVFWISDHSNVLVKDDHGREPDDKDYEETWETVYDERFGVEYGNGLRTPTTKINYGVKTGDYVVANLKKDRNGEMTISGVKKLTPLLNVSNSAWTGTSSVLVAGRSYTVPSSVLCYNKDNSSWITLEQARKYSEIADLYATSDDGVIRVIEVRHRG